MPTANELATKIKRSADEMRELRRALSSEQEALEQKLKDVKTQMEIIDRSISM